MDESGRDVSGSGRPGWGASWSKPARQAWSARARQQSPAGSTQPLCENCRHPLLPEHAVRSYHPHNADGPFAPLWRCFVHRDDCPPPRPTPEYRST